MKTRIKFYQYIIVGAILLSGCERDYLEPAPNAPMRAMSFVADIEPIMHAKCGSCHKSNGSSYPFLDLTTGNAYKGIMTNPNNKKYVDLTTPASGLFNTKIASGGSMNSYITAAERTKVLAWIQQGAVNN